MTAQELKNSILQLAIQGKLVEQRPEEGTAEELYRQIQSEKAKLLKADKIKKEKPLPEITEDEIPFEIPETWKWVRLGECTNYGQSKIKIKAADISPDTWSLDLEDIEKETGKVIARIPAQKRKIIGDKAVFHKGDILYSKLRPYLKKILIADGNGVCSSEIVPFTQYGNIDTLYLLYFLKTPHVDYVINSVTYGVKMPRVGSDTMLNLLVPLPPLEEQKRIVAKIEEIFPYIERFGELRSQLRSISEDLRKSILQQAIQGKLVEQRPEEGTAEELYRQIQSEKAKLLKAGKIKKEKPLPEITEDEIPFEIPETWKWVRLCTLCKSITDGDHQPPPQTLDGIPFLVITNVSTGKLDFSNTRFVSKDYFENLSQERIAEKGDILFTVTGSYGIPIKVDCNRTFCFQRHIALLKLLIDWDYLFYALKSPMLKSQCDTVATGTAQKTVGLYSLRNLILPLPPLREQKRIVSKIEELMELCDKLK